MPRIDVPADRDPLVHLWTERAPSLTPAAVAFSDAVYRRSTLPLREFEAARITVAEVNDCELFNRVFDVDGGCRVPAHTATR